MSPPTPRPDPAPPTAPDDPRASPSPPRPRSALARAVDALPWAFCAVAVGWAVSQRLRVPAPPPTGPAAAEVAVVDGAARATGARAAPSEAPPVAPRDWLDVVDAVERLDGERPKARTAVRAALVAVLDAGDHGGRPFAIVDKAAARLWLFDGRGLVAGTTPVLLGFARGDDSEPGIGDKPLSEVRPHERVTPAGRFLAQHGRNLNGEDVLWVDYDAAVSLHRLRPSHAEERRPQRMASRTAADNRITWGCINVPPAFYDGRLLPLVAGIRPVVYVLPETRPLATLFDTGSGWQAGGGAAAPAAGGVPAPRRDG